MQGVQFVKGRYGTRSKQRPTTGEDYMTSVKQICTPGELVSTVMKTRSEVTARVNAHPDPDLARDLLMFHLDHVAGETVFFNDCEEVRKLLGMEK